MEEIRWELLWRQMTSEEKVLCAILLALIVFRLGFKIFNALGLSGLFSSVDVDAAEDNDASESSDQTGEEGAGEPRPSPTGFEGAEDGGSDATHKWSKGSQAPGRKRLAVAVCYAVMFVFGALPVWRLTTALYRSEIPAQHIYHQGNASIPVIPLSLQVFLLPSPSFSSASSFSSTQEPSTGPALTASRLREIAQQFQHHLDAALTNNNIPSSYDASRTLTSLPWNVSFDVSVDLLSNSKLSNPGEDYPEDSGKETGSNFQRSPEDSSGFSNYVRRMSDRDFDVWLDGVTAPRQHGMYTLVLMEGPECEGPGIDGAAGSDLGERSHQKSAVEDGDDDNDEMWRDEKTRVGDEERSCEGQVLVLGVHRAAWVRGISPGTFQKDSSALKGHLHTWARNIAKHFGGQRGGGGGIHAGKTASEVKHWPVSAAGRTLLSFTLINAAPTPGHSFTWRFEEVERRFLSPVVQALRPVADITLDAQVLHHAQSKLLPKLSPSARAHVLQESDLPFFIDSEWPLDSAVAAPDIHILRFLVYVPPRAQCPLMVQRSDSQMLSTGAFVIPAWGGVVIWNPPGCNSSQTQSSNQSETHQVLDIEALQPLMRVVVAQLRTLLGLGPPPPPTHSKTEGPTSLPARISGFTNWEVDSLMWRQLASAHAGTLASNRALLEVVTALPNIVVTDQITHHLQASVSTLRNASLLAAQKGQAEEASKLATEAHARSERAFFHPSILSSLYFPGEHKLAVYLPLCFPIALSVIVRFVAEVSRYLRRFAAVHFTRRGMLEVKKDN